MSEIQVKEPTLTERDVLFEDEFLILIQKPSGLPTQPTLDPDRRTVVSELQRLRPGGYLGTHHRLDRDTSGVILFTKAKVANKSIADQFKEHRLKKTYVALSFAIKPPLVPQFKVKDFLKLTKLPGKKNRVISVRSGGDHAETQFKVLDSKRADRLLLIEAKPLTGRMHQIRVHLSEQGLPIVGDFDYGTRESREYSKKNHFERVMLHAAQLEFEHPTSFEPMTIRSEVPAEFYALARQK